MVRNILQKLRPSRSVMMTGFGMIVVGVVAYVVGRVTTTKAQQRPASYEELRSGPKTGYDGRVVAYIHGNIAVTREDLGEFLIARFGADHLEACVIRRIVELACKSRGIQVTDELVDLQLNQDLERMKLSRKDFVNLFLKPHYKTLPIWKEDVVRRNLMLAQLVGPDIKVTEDDLRKGFDGRHGEKVECRWIVLPDDNRKNQIWEKARESEAEFNKIATTLNIPQLCPSGGKAPPIHKHFGDANIERIAFNLAPGEVSPLIGMADKTVVILKCDKHIPRDLTKRFEEERASLFEEIRNLKLTVRINEVIGELRKQANPKLLLRNETRQDDLEREVLPEIRGQAAPNRVGG